MLNFQHSCPIQVQQVHLESSIYLHLGLFRLLHSKELPSLKNWSPLSEAEDNQTLFFLTFIEYVLPYSRGGSWGSQKREVTGPQKEGGHGDHRRGGSRGPQKRGITGTTEEGGHGNHSRGGSRGPQKRGVMRTTEEGGHGDHRRGGSRDHRRGRSRGPQKRGVTGTTEDGVVMMEW